MRYRTQTVVILLILAAFGFAGCDTASQAPSAVDETKASAETDKDDAASQSFNDDIGPVIGSEIIQTPTGPVVRLITESTKNRTLKDDIAAKSQNAGSCESSTQFAERGGNYPGLVDFVSMPGGYVLTGVGVDIRHERVHNVLLQGREILGGGDFGDREYFCSVDSGCGDPNVVGGIEEHFADLSDDYVVREMILDNDGTDFDRVNLDGKLMDWSAFRTSQYSSENVNAGDGSGNDISFSIVNVPGLTTDQVERTFITGLGLQTGRDLEGGPEGLCGIFGCAPTTDLVRLKAQFKTYDTACLQNLPDESQDSNDDGGTGSGGGGGGTGGGGGGGQIVFNPTQSL